MIPEYSIFLGLADNEVFYADLEVFMIMGHLPRSRGASGFAVDWLKLRGQVGFINRDLRLCLAFKKKITVYKLEKNKFIIKVRPRETSESVCKWSAGILEMPLSENSIQKKMNNFLSSTWQQ